MARDKRMTTTDEQRQSILEMRGIYKEMDDAGFAAMYCNRWKIPSREVLGVLNAEKKRANSH